MKWARHMVGMKDERLLKRSEAKKQGVYRKLGRLQRSVLKLKDRLKRHRKAEEEEK